MNTKDSDDMETETPETLYEEFMGAADQFDAAETDDTRQTWMDTAVALYEKITDSVEALSEAQQKRIKRTIDYLRDGAAGSE